VLRLDLAAAAARGRAAIWIAPISGGTDFAGAFVGGLRTLPVVRGEMQVRCLGAKVEAYSDPDAHGHGRPLIDEVGELVCTVPMPSMPLFLWGDDSGQRLRDSYFDMYRDAQGGGIWRHGDWIRIVPRGDDGHGRPTHHGAIIYGRSDATINRHGIRMGTAELYRAVEVQPEVLDSLVVDLEYLGRPSWMPCSWCCATACSWTTRCRRGCAPPSRRRCRHATCPTPSTRWPPCRARCRARRWSCR
jgi:acetoacetyl-CoA synthetase